VFENRVLRRIFGPKRDEVTGEWRKLHNKELRDLYSSRSIIRMIKLWRMRWAGSFSNQADGPAFCVDNWPVASINQSCSMFTHPHAVVVCTYQMNKMIPRLQTSTCAVYEPMPLVCSTSGATYSGVPQKVFMILCEFTNLERPKSDTFISVSRLSLDSRIFSG
jgi:hypothetical protein